MRDQAHQVGRAQQSRDDIIAEFDYRAAGTTGKSARCSEARADKGIDIGQLKFVTIPDVDNGPRAELRFRTVSERPAANLIMINYPLGLHLVFERSCCEVTVAETNLEHDCSTTSGSSGSPFSTPTCIGLASTTLGLTPVTGRSKRAKTISICMAPVITARGASVKCWNFTEH